MNTSSSISELDAKYNVIKSLPEKAFFVGLADYIRSAKNKTAIAPLIQDLYKKVHQDYLELELLASSKSTNTPTTETLESYIELGKKLGRQLDKHQRLHVKQQTDPAHAWLKLQLVEIMIHDPESAEKMHSKSDRGKYEYTNARRELDLILVTDENQYENEDYIFWMESGKVKSKADIPREFFKHEDYINYLNLVHSYFLDKLNDSTGESAVEFPKGKTVIYQDGTLYFQLDGLFPLTVNFGSSPELRKVFETLWEARVRNKDKHYSVGELIEIYKDLFKSEIDSHIFSTNISHIRRTKIKVNPRLRDRFQITYDKAQNGWSLMLQ